MQYHSFGDNWNDKKIERKWGRVLKWSKLYGKMQQPAKSRRSRWEVPIREARLGWSVGWDVVPFFGATIRSTKRIEGRWGIGLRWLKL